MRFKLLNVGIDNFSGEEVESKIRDFLKTKKLNQVVTVNPAFILKAQQDNEFKKVINNADLSVADGIGIKFAFWRHGKCLKKKIEELI